MDKKIILKKVQYNRNKISNLIKLKVINREEDHYNK
jgi:hypothetical protein